MKLRIKGNSLRLRISQSEMALLVETGALEETIYFAPDPVAKFSYALTHVAEVPEISLHYVAQKVTVQLSTEAVRRWAGSSETGIYGDAATGLETSVALIVEKDFACLDGDDPQDADAFPNPSAAVC